RKYLEQPDMAEMSWNPSIGDPDHMMYMLLSSDRFPPAFNGGYYQNDRVDDLLRRGRTTIDEKARVPLYREAQKLVVEDAPWIFVDHGKQVIVHRKRVQAVELLFALVRHRYGARLDEAQLAIVRETLEGLARDLATLRAVTIPDDAEPAQPFVPFRSEG